METLLKDIKSKYGLNIILFSYLIFSTITGKVNKINDVNMPSTIIFCLLIVALIGFLIPIFNKDLEFKEQIQKMSIVKIISVILIVIYGALLIWKYSPF